MNDLCRHPPDFLLTDRVEANRVEPPLPAPVLDAINLGIEKILEGELQNRVYLVGVRLEGVGVLNFADKRGHEIVVNGDHIAELTVNRDIAGTNTQFLLAFAERGAQQVRILRILAPSGEGYLPAVMGEVVGTPGQQEMVPASLGHQAHQDRCRSHPVERETRRNMIPQHLPQSLTVKFQRRPAVPLERSAAIVAA